MKKYTNEDYLAEKNAMSKNERLQQERFEQIINILVLYKQENQDKNIILSEETVNKAIQWFQKNMSSLVNLQK
jgi:response regulator of citrate/malate metabolism|tara:strand:+ start:3505 stop:3723 length:219 start_codon:yes stop_codon:yes gene_type:complete